MIIYIQILLLNTYLVLNFGVANCKIDRVANFSIFGISEFVKSETAKVRVLN